MEMSNRPKVRSLAKAKQDKEAQNGTMTVTLTVLQNSIAALNQLTAQPIPIRTSFLIGKIARAVITEMEQYRASLKSLQERLANKDDEGKPIMLEAVAATENSPGLPERYDVP